MLIKKLPIPEKLLAVGTLCESNEAVESPDHTPFDLSIMSSTMPATTTSVITTLTLTIPVISLPTIPTDVSTAATGALAVMSVTMIPPIPNCQPAKAHNEIVH